MRFRDYLKDHLSPIGGYILCVGLAASAFLIARYWRVRRFAARL